MTDIEFIQTKLADMNLKAVAKSCKLSYGTVYGLFTGKAVNPSYNTVTVLLKYLRGEE